MECLLQQVLRREVRDDVRRRAGIVAVELTQVAARNEVVEVEFEDQQVLCADYEPFVRRLVSRRGSTSA